MTRELLDHQWRDVVVVEGASSGLQVEEEVFQELDGDVLRGAFAVAFAVAFTVVVAIVVAIVVTIIISLFAR